MIMEEILNCDVLSDISVTYDRDTKIVTYNAILLKLHDPASYLGDEVVVSYNNHTVSILINNFDFIDNDTVNIDPKYFIILDK